MKNLFFLLIILIAAFSIRFYDVKEFPSNLTWDEAALGYNAYSILKTGRDEHGQFFPLIFKSFGDYKPGLYVYPTVISVALLGLNNLSVRLPSVIAGTLAVWGVYLLTNLLLNTYKVNFSRISKLGLTPGLAPALALALQPWHVFFSRTAWEVNLYTTLILFMLYFLLKSKKDPKYYSLSWLPFSLGFVAYQAAKMLSPLVFIFAHLIFYDNFPTILSLIKKSNKLLMAISLLLTGFVYLVTFTGSAGNRLATQNLLGYRPGISQEQKTIDKDSPLVSKFVHGQFELTSRLFIGRFLYHFSPEVLFYEGSVITQRGHIPRLGNLNLIESLLIPFGVFFLLRNSKSQKPLLLISLYLICAATPASLTLAEFSTFRSLPMSLGFAILSGLGLISLLELKFGFLIPAIFLFNAYYSLDIFLTHRSTVIQAEYNYGYKEAIEVIKKHSPKRIIFTDVYGQPYIYYLFYTQFDPAKYQQYHAFIDQGVDVGRVDRFDNIEFHQFNIGELSTQANTAFVGTKGNLPLDTIGDYANLKDFKIIKPEKGQETLRVAITK